MATRGNIHPVNVSVQLEHTGCFSLKALELMDTWILLLNKVYTFWSEEKGLDFVLSLA